MEDTTGSRAMPEAILALLYFLAGVIFIPLALGFAFGVPAHVTLGLIAAILIFQPFAAAVGAGLSLPPVFIVATMISVALSVIFGIGAICEGFSERSIRLSRFIANVKGIADRFSFFQKIRGLYAHTVHSGAGCRVIWLRHSRLAVFWKNGTGGCGDHDRLDGTGHDHPLLNDGDHRICPVIGDASGQNHRTTMIVGEAGKRISDCSLLTG